MKVECEKDCLIEKQIREKVVSEISSLDYCEFCRGHNRDTDCCYCRVDYFQDYIVDWMEEQNK